VVALDRLAVGFVRLLRAAGMEVPVGTTVLFGEALGALGALRRSSVYCRSEHDQGDKDRIRRRPKPPAEGEDRRRTCQVVLALRDP
jgi:hypothetical protein